MNLLRSMEDIVTTMQRIVVDTVEASKPSGIVFGTVETINPLTIRVDQKLVLESENLLLTSGVMDYYTEMTVDHLTDNRDGGSGEGAFDSHNHAVTGKKVFLVHNGLKVDDQVLMLKNQGGQLYVVLDRVVQG